MEFKQIKLIIWDLDETFWNGTISEDKVAIADQNKKLIKDLIDAGVMCSICSKNNEEEVNLKLKEEELLDYFVFSSINWSPKGERVKQIISEMNLRAPNVLFIDDNPLNREEVLATCDGIMVSDVDVIESLCKYYEEITKKDASHERLKQYRILEEKKKFRAISGSNIEFLKKSSIKVIIKNDCENHLDRIEDLVARSNQLNFTKIRSTKEEITTLLNDPEVKSGYISVSDNFGDYGIVGFYAYKNDELIHFTFSCRTLGMGIEQYVYKEIGKPKLTVVGEVNSDVNSPNPYWINNSEELSPKKNQKDNINSKIVLKGLCDMQQMFAYIAENSNIITEFEYVNTRGVSIEQRNHTSHVVQSLKINDKDKVRLYNYLPFGDKEMYTTSLFDDDIKFVVFSLFTDPNLGMYKEKETGIIVAFGEYTNDLTDQKNWDGFINKTLFVANCNFTKEFLKDFSEKFEFMGRIDPQGIINNIDTIYSNINKDANLVLVLGSEREYTKNDKEAYADRHLYHKQLNDLVKIWLKDKERVSLLDINEIATTESDYTNNINHFSRSVYFAMSNKLISIIEENSGQKLKQNGELVANLTHLKRKIGKLINLIISLFVKK